MTGLIPFKAHFEYKFDGAIDKLHEPENLKVFLSRVSQDNETASTVDFLRSYLVSADIPIFKRDRKIPFDFNTRHSIQPEFIRLSNLKSTLEFKVDSESVEVIQINGDEITFVTNDKSVYTERISESIRLVKN